MGWDTDAVWVLRLTILPTSSSFQLSFSAAFDASKTMLLLSLPFALSRSSALLLYGPSHPLSRIPAFLTSVVVFVLSRNEVM